MTGTAGATGAGVVQGAVQETSGRPSAGDEIEKLRRVLLQPGPEARDAREKAVDTLLLMKDRDAHGALVESLSRGDDTDGLSRFILSSLARRLGQKRDPVFGEPAVRSEIVDVYFPVWLRCYQADNRVDPPFAGLALRCLRELTPLERDRSFRRILAEDAELAPTALAAAGGCEDLNLAPVLADKLADPAVGEAARAALMRLTFAPAPFRTREEFDRWQGQNRDKTYKELAVEAADRARAAVEDVRAAKDALILQQTKKLIRALTSAGNIDWALLHQEILRPEPAGGTAAYLEELRAALVEKNSLPGVSQDRLAFAQALQVRLATTSEPGEYALLLETIAHLQVRENAEQLAAVETLLRNAVAHASPAVRRAALLGLERYPSARNRAAVVNAASAALIADDRSNLHAALSCLQGRNWHAPTADAADLKSWLGLLQRVFAADLSVDLKVLATKVALMHDRDQHLVPQVFPLLANVVRDHSQPSALRTQTLIRLSAFTGSEPLAEDYVGKVIGLLADTAPEVRKLAAEQLKNLPVASKPKTREWNQRILERAAERLLVEPEARVLRAVVDLLRAVAGDQSLAPEVVKRFNAEVARFAETKPPPEEVFRQELLVDGLRILGSGQVRDVEQWVTAGRALVKLRERDALRNILTRQQVATLINSDAEGIRDAWGLVIEAALMKPADVGWDQLVEEAKEVQIALDELERLGGAYDSPASRRLRIEVFAGIGMHQEVDVVGERYLNSPDRALTGADRVAVILAVAGSRLRLGKLAEAGRALRSLEPLGANPPRAADLWIELADLHLRNRDSHDALQILSSLVRKLPEDSAQFRACFLLEATARFAVDPDKNRDAVLQDLDRKASLFSGEEVPKELADQFNALRLRVRSFRG